GNRVTGRTESSRSLRVDHAFRWTKCDVAAGDRSGVENQTGLAGPITQGKGVAAQVDRLVRLEGVGGDIAANRGRSRLVHDARVRRRGQVAGEVGGYRDVVA